MSDKLAEAQRSIELKARVTNLQKAETIAADIGAQFVETLYQVDTYFRCDIGRLKLREINGAAAELIWYDRPADTAARTSHYRLTSVPDPAGMTALLSAGLGVRGVVRKARRLWMWENVRLHFDTVDGLGAFFECEAVIRTAADVAPSEERVQRLRIVLALRQSDLIAGSYADLAGL
ncbi:MAG TPA: class IV adenylate cyclase [Tepidisphaeraceae bacterium]|jgi:predicted adenylyl cyclase CyaB